MRRRKPTAKFLRFDIPHLTDAEAVNFDRKIETLVESEEHFTTIEEYLLGLRELLRMTEEVVALSHSRNKLLNKDETNE